MSQCPLKQSTAVPPESVDFFHGKITRDQAEALLTSKGGSADGLFLLRESVNNNYAVSICYAGRVHHYNIEKQRDGTYQIPTGRKFPGPVELIEHHGSHLDGFLTSARTPLRLGTGESPLVLQDLRASELERQICLKALEMGIKSDNISSTATMKHLRHLVLKDLHQFQAWYHGLIRRKDSELRLLEAGNIDGSFLVRYKPFDGVYVLSLMFHKQSRHYKIEQTQNGLSIEGGQLFQTLIELVDHYHFRQDGLLCKLRSPVKCTDLTASKSDWSQGCEAASNFPTSKHDDIRSCGVNLSSRFRVNDDLIGIRQQSSGVPHKPSNTNKSEALSVVEPTNRIEPSADLVKVLPLPANDLNNEIRKGGLNFGQSFGENSHLVISASLNDASVVGLSVRTQLQHTSLNTALHQSLNSSPIIDAPWEEPEGSEEQSQTGSSSNTLQSKELGDVSECCSHHPSVSSFCNSSCCQSRGSRPKASTEKTREEPVIRPNRQESSATVTEETQKIYDSLPDSVFFLNSEQLILMERLGGGNFGFVVRAIYRTPQAQDLPVAVKTLKDAQISLAGEESIIAEAKLMSQLKHRHIVRLIGVCKANRFMLLLELAPLGPINKFLKKHTDVSICLLTQLMYQVAEGMAYLESCKFVHRDLAARNVLLVTQSYAKISDFGMSKALSFGNDYYRATSAGRWPLKWYAPECIYYFRFDSKSDVWSFGITLWEVYSFGERPYKDMKGAQILSMLDQGLRLSKPLKCPEAVYALMHQCWNFESSLRPSFSEVVFMMSRLVQTMLVDTSRQHPVGANNGSPDIAFF